MSRPKIENFYQAKRFKKAREILKLSQNQLADSLKLPVHKIKSIEIGKVKISVEIALLMEEKFNLNFKWLLTGEGPMWLESPDQCERDKQDIGESIKSWIDNFLKNASEEEKHWFKVQFSKCFPEFLEWMEKRKKK